MDYALTTAVTTSTTALDVPAQPADQPCRFEWVTVTALAACWVSAWGADAVAAGDNCVYIPAGGSRTFPYRSTGLNAVAVTGTTSVVVDAWATSDYVGYPR